MTATEILVEPFGHLLAYRSGNGWKIREGADFADPEYSHVLVWDNESDLLTLDLPADEQELLEQLLQKCRAVVPDITRADLVRTALRYADSLPPDEFLEEIVRVRKKDERSAEKEPAPKASSRLRDCGRCGMLLPPDSTSCIHCGATNQ